MKLSNTVSNRLQSESSPYLRQHAHNPVDWYPWGGEAFAQAQAQNKLIFLSIGYSTCHWCHVMAHESFEDREVAALLNQFFVCIKVDREELPDVDHVCMRVCQITTGSGGWPLTILMTADKLPVFAGTYFAKESSPYRVGLMDLLRRVAQLWGSERNTLIEEGQKVLAALQQEESVNFQAVLDAKIQTAALEQLQQRYDKRHHGFGGAPKFPMFYTFSFLLSQTKARAGQGPSPREFENPTAMAINSLRAIRLGGIYDHVGFGVHRYSTDEEWKLPHFEKMLYDQALAIAAYVDAALYVRTNILSSLTNDNGAGQQPLHFGLVAEEICQYVLRDLKDFGGGFYAAQDADSDGVEGKFYVWEEEELTRLGMGDAMVRAFHVSREGNFRDEATHQATWKNNLYLSEPLSAALQAEWELFRPRLFSARQLRVHPGTDTKIITGWNGLMISALARAGMAFQNNAYVQAAQSAYGFLRQKLARLDGRLLRCYGNEQAQHLAVAEDYAFLTAGLIDLYQASLDANYLNEARHWQNEMLKLFWDHTDHGFFFSGSDAERIILRSKDVYDGALPSANSVALRNLARLSLLTPGGEQNAISVQFRECAQKLSNARARMVNAQPSAFLHFVDGVRWLEPDATLVKISGELSSSEVSAARVWLQTNWLPYTLWVHAGEGAEPKFEVCRNFVCHAPVTTAVELKNILLAPFSLTFQE